MTIIIFPKFTSRAIQFGERDIDVVTFVYISLAVDLRYSAADLSLFLTLRNSFISSVIAAAENIIL